MSQDDCMRHLLLTTTVLMTLPAMMAASPFENLAEVEVLTGWRLANGDHMAALRITLRPGWKTYWRAPGDGGIPPQFNFSGSETISSVTPHWPVPEVFDQNGLRSIGYNDGVVFPITVSNQDASAPIQINGELNIGVCEEICVPVALDFNATLPVTGDRDTSITAALLNRPLTASEANVGAVICAISPIEDGLRLTTSVDVAPTGTSEFVIIEAGTPGIWVSEANVSRAGNQLSATVDMFNNAGTAFALDRSAVRITLLGSDQAIDIQGCAAS